MQFYPNDVDTLSNILKFGGVSVAEYGIGFAVSMEEFLAEISSGWVTLSMCSNEGKLKVSSTVLRMTISQKYREKRSIRQHLTSGEDVKVVVKQLIANHFFLNPEDFELNKVIPCSKQITESVTYPGLIREYLTLTVEYII